MLFFTAAKSINSARIVNHSSEAGGRCSGHSVTFAPRFCSLFVLLFYSKCLCKTVSFSLKRKQNICPEIIWEKVRSKMEVWSEVGGKVWKEGRKTGGRVCAEGGEGGEKKGWRVERGRDE